MANPWQKLQCSGQISNEKPGLESSGQSNAGKASDCNISCVSMFIRFCSIRLIRRSEPVIVSVNNDDVNEKSAIGHQHHQPWQIGINQKSCHRPSSVISVKALCLTQPSLKTTHKKSNKLTSIGTRANLLCVIAVIYKRENIILLYVHKIWITIPILWWQTQNNHQMCWCAFSNICIPQVASPHPRVNLTQIFLTATARLRAGEWKINWGWSPRHGPGPLGEVRARNYKMVANWATWWCHLLLGEGERIKASLLMVDVCISRRLIGQKWTICVLHAIFCSGNER